MQPGEERTSELSIRPRWFVPMWLFFCVSSLIVLSNSLSTGGWWRAIWLKNGPRILCAEC